MYSFFLRLLSCADICNRRHRQIASKELCMWQWAGSQVRQPLGNKGFRVATIEPDNIVQDDGPMPLWRLWEAAQNYTGGGGLRLEWAISLHCVWTQFICKKLGDSKLAASPNEDLGVGLRFSGYFYRILYHLGTLLKSWVCSNIFEWE